ncbi:hypothetical protein A1O3_03684 [Capronia epimyces CBS 606.96]|uniref:Uncharacterized protein n=1 Tax=Capronia epimyces CBS 606.96 TaxID=1182542 RepID=W9YAP5_9EURO|nr:uncharacterized protein A1O3_03684 [Capronia epimyces CBS 606.96]EXJ86730.1 hypothetical protein A1O3_03684 [Capronia epimyces CBS 606.96]
MDFELPESSHSQSALEFIGFNPSMAKTIYERWLQRPDADQNPDDLIDYVMGHILMMKSNQYAEYSARDVMEVVGLKQDMQDALTDPRFQAIFETQTLHFWVRDILATNYATLIRLQQRLKNHAKRGSVHDIFQPAAPTVPEVTATVNVTPEDHLLPTAFIAIAEEGPVLPDHVVLYKGKAAQEMRVADQMSVAGQFIEDDGEIDMHVISSYPGGDFNSRHMAWYFTPEKEVAEEYRKWAARRSPNSETLLIRIQIPLSFVNSLSVTDLCFSPDWKEYVWCCKRQSGPPAKFESLYMGTTDVVKGHICTGVNKVHRIKKEAVQKKITEDFVMHVPSTGAKATQWAFMNPSSVDRLGEEIRGKVHIDIFASQLAQEQQISGPEK